MKRHKFSKTSVEFHDDGSALVHHMHESDPTQDVRHAAGDLDDVHDSLQSHLNPEMEEALEEKVHPGLHQEALGLTGHADDLEEKIDPGIHQKVMDMAKGKE